MPHLAIVGCGQLAQMLAHAAIELDCRVTFLAEANEDRVCVEGLGNIIQLDSITTPAELFDAMGKPDVITVERESVDTYLLRQLQKYCPVYPDPRHIEITQHRYKEKQALQSLNVPVAPFRNCDSFDAVESAVSVLGCPAFIKLNEQGYDGKNQWRISNATELEPLRSVLNTSSSVVEAGVDFTREVSLIVARNKSGDTKFYSMAENHHERGILLRSYAPAQADLHTINTAKEYLSIIVNSWDYVGVLAMECFDTDNGLVINELAPRVHNSGHWTMDGAVTSQFSNHIRAILDLPLADTSPQGYSAMLNILGPAERSIETVSEGKVYWYGKTSRDGRKMGHINFVSPDPKLLTTMVAKGMTTLRANAENHPASDPDKTADPSRQEAR